MCNCEATLINKKTASGRWSRTCEKCGTTQLESMKTSKALDDIMKIVNESIRKGSKGVPYTPRRTR